MDIFGTIATAAHLANELTLYCIAVKDARADAKELQGEMATVSVLLKSCEDVLREAHQHKERHIAWEEFSLSLNATELEILKAFGDELQKFEKRVDASQTRGLKRLVWPFTQSENKAMIDKIGRFKATLNIALGVELV
jgi:hypothetical protein